MAIADIKAAVETPWRTCAVCHALDNIPPDEATALRDLLRNKGVRYSELSEKLAEDPDTPLKLDRDALSRHARGFCAARERLR